MKGSLLTLRYSSLTSWQLLYRPEGYSFYGTREKTCHRTTWNPIARYHAQTISLQIIRLLTKQQICIRFKRKAISWQKLGFAEAAQIQSPWSKGTSIEELSHSFQCCNWSQPLFKYCSISAAPPTLRNPFPSTANLFYLNLPPALKAGHQREVLSVTSLTPSPAMPTSHSSHFTPLLLSLTPVHLPQCLSKLSFPHSSPPDKKLLIYSLQENENWNNKKNTLTPCDIS